MSRCADCGCKCGMRTQCGNENCVCACHEFDHMHCWQYVALCKTCKPDLNVSELKGLSRNDLFSYISFHMTRVEFNKLYLRQSSELVSRTESIQVRPCPGERGGLALPQHTRLQAQPVCQETLA